MKAKVQIREDVELARPGARGVLLGEAVREAGLDPEVFAAVLPGHCGYAGRLNSNGRVYDVATTVAEHERLCEAASTSPTFGERDHPDAGPTWNVITRFLGGHTELNEDGSATFHGRFGVLASTLGRDMLVNWRAGVPVGVSLRGRAYAEDVVITEGSELAAMNPGAVGKRVKLMTETELDGYDWVRTPSAGTFIAPPNPEVTEALRRLTEAIEAKEEAHMTFDEIRKAHPEAIKTLLSEAVAEAENKARVELDRLTAELNEAKGKLTEATAANAGISAQLTELVEAHRAAVAEAKAAKLRAEIGEAVDTAIKGRRAGAMLKGLVMDEVADGRIESVEAAVARVERLAKLTEAAVPTGGAAPATGAVTEAADGGVGTEAPKGAVSNVRSLF